MRIPCLLIHETSESLSSTAFDSRSDGIPGLDHPLTMPIIIKDNEADAAAPICNIREKKQIHQLDPPFCKAFNDQEGFNSASIIVQVSVTVCMLYAIARSDKRLLNSLPSVTDMFSVKDTEQSGTEEGNKHTKLLIFFSCHSARTRSMPRFWTGGT